MKTPTHATVKKHFAKAKEIRCLTLNTTIGVAMVKNFLFDEKENAWTGPLGLVTFWKDGKYAEITKKKCGDCKNCKPCVEKRKLKS